MRDDHPDAVAFHDLHSVERRLRHPAVEHAPDEEPHLTADRAVGLDNLGHLLEERRFCPLDAPPRLLDQPGHLLVAGEGQPPAVRELPEFLDGFPGNIDLLRADLQAALAGRAVEEPLLDGVGDPVPRVPGIEGEAHLLPEHRRPGELRHLERRAGRYAGEALDTVPERLDRLDLLPCRELCVRRRTYPGDLRDHRAHIHRQVFQDREVQRLDRHTVAGLRHAGEGGCPVHLDGAAPALPGPATVAVGERRVALVADRVEGVEHPGALVDPDRILLEAGLRVLNGVVAGDPEGDLLHAGTSRHSIPSRARET